MKNVKEKCYITRDSSSDWVWIWRKPDKGTWAPSDNGSKENKNFQRADRSLEKTDAYYIEDFKNKFGTSIKQGMRKCTHLLTSLIDSEDYKLFSNDKNRKK